MQMLTIVVLAAVLSICTAYGGNNFYFPPDSTLTCMVQNPRFGEEGQARSKPEDVPVIPFRPNVPGEPYLPLESGFTPPIQNAFYPADVTRKLLDFVGDQLNNQLTNVGEFMPTSRPPIAGNLIPIRIITSGDEEGTKVRRLNYTEDILSILDELNPPVSDIERAIILRNMNRLLSRCQVRAKWQRLPPGYFPQWYSATFCSGETCSLPSGLICEPVLQDTTLLHITVLRWDCCWSLQNNQWRWECGFRKVRIALIGQCHCGCGPLYVGDGFRYTGRIGGPFTLDVGDLNTT